MRDEEEKRKGKKKHRWRFVYVTTSGSCSQLAPLFFLSLLPAFPPGGVDYVNLSTGFLVPERFLFSFSLLGKLCSLFYAIQGGIKNQRLVLFNCLSHSL